MRCGKRVSVGGAHGAEFEGRTGRRHDRPRRGAFDVIGRNELGLTQEDVAGQAEIDRPFVTLIESAKKQPTVSVLWKLAAALQLSPAEFAERVDRRYTASLAAAPKAALNGETKKAGHLANVRLLGNWSRRQESNLDLSLRRAEFYPLKYSERLGLRQNRSLGLSPIRRPPFQLLRSRRPRRSSARSPGRPDRRGSCAGRWPRGRRRRGRAASSGSGR